MPDAQLALDGGTPVRLAPFVGDEAARRSPSAEDGHTLEGLRAALARLVGERPAVACRNREEALALAIRFATREHPPEAIEIAMPTVGAEVAARAALALGLRVLPVDVDADTANISARALAPAITERTRAVLVTHAFGHPATMPDLVRIAERYSLAVIEDITESLGADYAGTPVGTMGAVAAFGGGPGHVVTAEIGAVLPGDAEGAAVLEGWRGPTGPAEAGTAAALDALGHLDEELLARRQAAWHLTYELRAVRGVSPMHHGRHVRHGYDRYVLRLRSVLWSRSVEETAAALAAEGIPATAVIGSMLHEDRDVIERLGAGDERIQPERFNHARQLASELIAIPLDGALTSRDMDDVADAIRKVAAASQRVDAR
ncbi:MAG: DegT/DnrJ/EryC1/StrS family aminotransferase [Dehalococcoidia bacterium]|nr:DegT/DnrJ/EryC1/StrS family aminotransferase [Dehalococcoidia bacterium]